MRGHSAWNYAPYKPLLHDVGDIYICCLVPKVDTIHLEWLSIDAEEYAVFYRERGTEEFVFAGRTRGTEFDITGLPVDTDFEFYVEAGDKKSRIRLARTGETIGSVVNYLHPEDNVYSFSGHCLCSPSLVRHPDGFLLASMDVYASNYPQNLTLIFRSDDEGENWHYVTELMPSFWGKMFIHKGELYMLSCSTSYGDLLIGKSTDGGKTWSTPVALLRGSTGKNGEDGVHKNPQNIYIYNGRLYNTLEWGAWANKDHYHAAMVMSIDVNDDLMVPENWSFSEPLVYDPNWEGVAVGETKATIEGTLCVAPDGNLYNVMRYNIREAVPEYGLVLSYKVNTEDHDAPLQYSHAIEMPCNNTKFMIKYDEVSQKYYSIVTRIDCAERRYKRDLLSLMSSADMEHWDLVCDLFDKRDDETGGYGFQYVDFEMEGEDIIYLCRTAYNKSQNAHDTNLSTFHRIKNFRTL